MKFYLLYFIFEKKNPKVQQIHSVKEKAKERKFPRSYSGTFLTTGAHRSPLGYSVRGEFVNFHQELHLGAVNVSCTME